MKQDKPKLNKQNIIAILLFLVVLFFLLVGTSLVNENKSEQLQRNDSETLSLYEQVLEKIPFIADKEVMVPYSDKANKDTSSAPITVSKVDEQLIKERCALHQTLPDVPKDKAYVEVNNGVPMFTENELTGRTESWEEFGALDQFNRVTPANALIGADLMPAEADERESLGHVQPTGWQQKRYPSLVDGGWLYNRSHMIGYQLTGQQDNVLNLLTGTRYFNVVGMLPFENYVAHYIETNDVHVRYRVTPLFIGNELLARGVFMEGYSVEDNGKLAFHVFVANKQPKITINYLDGTSKKASGN